MNLNNKKDKEMNTHVFTITAKTNLHVGNESGGDFTIIDKAIQRDPLTGLPCINSSSLKGAINEFLCHHKELMSDEKRTELLGSDKTGKIKGAQKGKAIFFDAKLLLLPQQDDDNLYHYVTSQKVINMMSDRVKLFKPEFSFAISDKYKDKEVKKDGDKISVLCHDDNLPIIARNVLDNGESKNLWYEQVLPAETVLYTIIQEEGDELAKALNGQIVQIGANATIGYGYCKFEEKK